MASDNVKIKRLFLDPHYRGSFAGAATFYRILRDDADQHKFKDLTYKRVLDVLQTIPTYQEHVQKKRRGVTRHIKYEADVEGGAFVPGQGQVFHADLAQMIETDDHYRYFLIMVDVWDNYVYVESLKTKSRLEVLGAFKKIIKENQLDLISVCYVDEGSEFLSNKAALEKLGIRLIVLKGQSKAFKAENFIRTVKRRLFRLERSKFSKAWNQDLQQVVENINKSPSRPLNNLTPASVNSPFSDSLVRQERQIAQQGKDKLQSQVTKQRRRPPKNGGTLYNVGQLVYPDLPATMFDDKSYHIARGEVYRVVKVDTTQEPFLYSLVNMADKPVKRKFYAWEMRSAPKEPFKVGGAFTAVEKVLGEKKDEHGNTLYHVKYLHYPLSMADWVLEKDLKGYKLPEEKDDKKNKKTIKKN